MSEHLFYYIAAVPVLGVLAQMISYWLRLPSILLLLTFGVLLGLVANPDAIMQEISGGTDIGPSILFPIVSLAVAIILFEGGLTLNLEELKESGTAVFRMVTVGAVVSCLLTTVAAWKFLALDWRIALLLGAILVVTGPTVIAPLIRHIRPSKKMGSILKWEGIVIDPIGAVLAVLVFEQVIHAESEQPVLAAIWLFLQTAALGVGFAWILSRVLGLLVNRFLIPDFLHGVVFLAAALGSYALSDWIIPESGLVTVTALGVFLANMKSISIGHVVEFKENLGILLISCLFIVLGSRLDLAQLTNHGPGAVLFVVALIVVVRPASIFISLAGTGTPFKEQLFLALVAPRGIVAAAVGSVFALKVLTLASHDEHLESLVASTRQLEPAIFLVIVSTVAFYGLLAAPLARMLGLADTNPQGLLFASATDWVRDLATVVKKSGFPVILVDTNYSNISKARQAGMTAHCASILSEEVEKQLELSGVGRLFAVTRNDEVNELATNDYARLFGKKNVYRLAPGDSKKGTRSSLAGNVGGRVLFGAEHDEDALWTRYRQGWRFRATKLSEEFGIDDFRAMHGEKAFVAMYIESGNLRVITADIKLEPKSGQTLIAMVPPESSRPDQAKTNNGQ